MLKHLLRKFDDWNTNQGSLYGREMDRALAADLRWGLPWYDYAAQDFQPESE